MSDLLVERECKGTKKNVYVQTKFVFVAIDYFFCSNYEGIASAKPMLSRLCVISIWLLAEVKPKSFVSNFWGSLHIP